MIATFQLHEKIEKNKKKTLPSTASPTTGASLHTHYIVQLATVSSESHSISAFEVKGLSYWCKVDDDMPIFVSNLFFIFAFPLFMSKFVR
jgi:hypothetical protein